MGDITYLLEQVRGGGQGALDQLAGAIHDRLRAMAHARVGRERRDPLLETTVLVNEAVLRLVRAKVFHRSPHRRYLYAAASRTMRAILVDHARRRRTAVRAGLENRVMLDDVVDRMESDGLPIVELNQALDELARCHPRQATVIDLRYFGGRSIKEISEMLGFSVSTVENDFRIARAWLRARLEGEADR
jgi:RNA polymerase sigma-70 factor, ECF subfamily